MFGSNLGAAASPRLLGFCGYWDTAQPKEKTITTDYKTAIRPFFALWGPVLPQDLHVGKFRHSLLHPGVEHTKSVVNS